MVKQKYLHKVLLHKNSDILLTTFTSENSDIFYFSATRNQCNGETEMFYFEEVLFHRNSDIFYFPATRNQCNGETEMFCFEEVLFHRNSDIF